MNVQRQSTFLSVVFVLRFHSEAVVKALDPHEKAAAVVPQRPLVILGRSNCMAAKWMKPAWEHCEPGEALPGRHKQ